jgi:dienelactone hydrolase
MAPAFLGASIVGLLGQGPLLTAGALFPGKTDTMVLSWENALKKFLDQTGKPGPSQWQSGTYPAGEDDYPVRGVSWYEGAAYAEFAGKSLPTVAHWVRASGHRHAGAITELSNFQHSGPARVGTYPGLGPFGTLDMAGNAREWCWNKSQDRGDRRLILGGAWDEPAYLFQNWDTAPSLDRSRENGFRCMRVLSEKTPPAVFADIFRSARDYEKERPVSDERFQGFKSLYAYVKAPLNARTESTEESADSIHQTVTFDAAYGRERVIAHLYLPRQGKPPYQTVVFFPGNMGFWAKTPFPGGNPPSVAGAHGIATIVRGGRAVLFTVYKGTYDRWVKEAPFVPQEMSWGTRLMWVIQWYQDFARSVDYLHERSDIDHEKLGYLGASWGASMGLINLALDDRFKAAVLAYGGLPRGRIALPEMDHLNFVSRVRVPVLMIDSKNDPFFPLETSQLPMFRLLGTPQKDKHFVPYDVSGHAVPDPMWENEMLSWLDLYLGKVR